MIQFPTYMSEKKPVYKKFETDPLVWLKNFGTFVFVFCAINSYHQAYTTVKFPTVRRVVKMGLIAYFFVAIISASFGFAAYFSLGQKIVNVGLFPDREPLDGSKDIANKILKFGKKTFFYIEKKF